MATLAEIDEGGGPQQSPASGGFRGPRRVLRLVGWILVWSGALVLAFLAYQLWGTALYNQGAQHQLEEVLAERAADGLATAPTPTTVGQSATRPAPVTRAASEVVAPSQPLVMETAPVQGVPIGRIIIPTAEVDNILVEGVDPRDLKKGPGHMPWTPLPGQPGNSVISGHRTTYGAPFFHLDRVAIGDDIHVETLIGRHTYRVRKTLVVEPTDVWVTDPLAGAWLTLTTCTPRYSAAQRLVIVAELVEGPNLTAIMPVKTLRG